MNNYEDIINHPHHVSKIHQRLSDEQRAAQFSPFAALTGYEERIKETSRRTTDKINLTNEEWDIINNKIQLIQENIKSKPVISITYFIPDKKKSGGSYDTIKGNIRRIDEVNKFIEFEDRTKIDIKYIIGIYGDIFTTIEY